MRKLVFLAIILIGITTAHAVPPSPPDGPYTDTDCDQAKYYTIGRLCQDTDDGKLYKGTGAGITEIAAGATGDTAAPATNTAGAIPTWAGANSKTLVDGLAPARGSMVYGNAAGAWAGLTKGAAGTVLKSDGTDISWSATPSLQALTLTGANTLSLGTSSTNTGSAIFKNATNANAFTITSGVSGAAIGWTLPTAAPGGAAYLLTVDADGTMGYADPTSVGLPADPNAHRIAMWDDTANASIWGVIGAGLTFTQATGTLSVTSAGDAAADGATKGIATFTAADFDAAAGVISIDYTNGQAASGAAKGFLTAADWTTFNGKQAALTRPVTGPASGTTGNMAVLGSLTGGVWTVTDGGTPFDRTAPGAIGGSTPAAGTFTSVSVGTGTSITRDGSGNLSLTDAVTGTKTLAQLVPSTPSNLELSANQVPGTLDGATLSGIDIKGTASGGLTAATAGVLTFAEVDASTTKAITAANVSRTFVNSYGRSGAATIDLPAAAAGYTFVAIVGTQHDSAWKIQIKPDPGTDRIYWDADGTLTAGKTYFQETNQAVGSRVSCATFRTGASAYSWLCGKVSGTWVTD